LFRQCSTAKFREGMANSRRWTFGSLNMGSCYPGQLRTRAGPIASLYDSTGPT
jgi:hypothetical protein